jgi:hypothetical protein
MRTRPVGLVTFPFLLLAEIFGHTVVARTLGAAEPRGTGFFCTPRRG